VPRGQRDGSLDRILGFLDRSSYFFLQVAPQLYSRGSLDPVPDLVVFFLTFFSENLVVPGIEPEPPDR
jgi:hypothetical protein